MQPETPNDEFYVGYLPVAPQGYTRLIRPVAIALLVLVASLGTYVALHQRGFATSNFEYGKLTELEGVLYHQPVPLLRVKVGQDDNGRPLYQSVLLVNFLKHGADDLLKGYEQTIRKPLERVKVRVRGTLLYYDGVTMLELTEGEKALVSILEETTSASSPLTEELGETTLTGEIVDSKCYFGVMKPSGTKPHRSCAIRCISGGIPPVLVTRNDRGESNYFLVTGSEGEAINNQVLDYVAAPVRVKGQLERHDDWYVLKLDPNRDITRVE